jgi:hypothetical protein
VIKSFCSWFTTTANRLVSFSCFHCIDLFDCVLAEEVGVLDQLPIPQIEVDGHDGDYCTDQGPVPEHKGPVQETSNGFVVTGKWIRVVDETDPENEVERTDEVPNCTKIPIVRVEYED